MQRFLILNSKSRKFCHVLYFDVYLYSEEWTLSSELKIKGLKVGQNLGIGYPWAGTEKLLLWAEMQYL